MEEEGERREEIVVGGLATEAEGGSGTPDEVVALLDRSKFELKLRMNDVKGLYGMRRHAEPPTVTVKAGLVGQAGALLNLL